MVIDIWLALIKLYICYEGFIMAFLFSSGLILNVHSKYKSYEFNYVEIPYMWPLVPVSSSKWDKDLL